MKISKLQFIFSLFCFFCLSTTIAQYGYGNGYGNRYGRQRSTVPQAQDSQKEAKPLTAEQLVDAEMPNIVEKLGLNPFEEAVVKTTLVKYVQQRIELQILKLEGEQLREGMEKIQKNQEAELKAGLPADKYEAFVELQKNRFKKSKKKKKKKNKEKSKD